MTPSDHPSGREPGWRKTFRLHKHSRVRCRCAEGPLLPSLKGEAFLLVLGLGPPDWCSTVEGGVASARMRDNTQQECGRRCENVTSEPAEHFFSSMQPEAVVLPEEMITPWCPLQSLSLPWTRPDRLSLASLASPPSFHHSLYFCCCCKYLFFLLRQHLKNICAIYHIIYLFDTYLYER